MGKVTRHNVEISNDKGTVFSVCQCGWRNKETNNDIARAKAHLHIAEQVSKP